MRLTKHHGLGNDFLVVLDLDGTHPVGPSDAVALCDRRTGIGADGLLHVTAGRAGADVTMALLNADGSSAEMSGNGIRCLAQAVFQAGVVEPPALQVATEAGPRTVRLVGGHVPTQRMSVEMGQAKVTDADGMGDGADVHRAARVDVGNPHLVLEWAGTELPGPEALVALAAPIDQRTPGGINVEVVRPSADGTAIDMVVYERGVGPTQACGTGACAVAAAAHEWGLSGTSANVRMPGGPVEVTLGDPVLLVGDVTFVAHLDTTWS